MGDLASRTARARPRPRPRPRMVRRAAAGTICLAAVVAAATACGGGGGSAHGASGGTHRPSGTAVSGTAGASASAGAAGSGPERTLSQRQLEQAAVGPADLPGWKTSTLTGRGPDGVEVTPVILNVTRLPRASPAACAPIGGIAVGPDSATRQHYAVFRQFVVPKADADRMLTETMLGYRPADARGMMADLRASLKTCTSLAFPAFAGEDPKRYADPVTQQAPSLGDEAVEFGITEIVPSVDASGDDDQGAPVKAPHLFLAVRSGATVVVFSAQGFPGDHLRIPVEPVSAQIAKLAKVG